MIRINLLPHREEKRRQRKNTFFAMLAAALVLGAIVVAAGAVFIATKISDQDQRNNFIKAENARLDAQIAEIVTLKQEIDALKARQQAVEDLQSDRNQPVFLMDELVKQVPEGIFLKTFKQSGQRVILNGFAQSNERVSELLRNLSNSSPWLERPDLIEIRAATVGVGRETKKVFDFTINVGIKRPRDKEAAAKAAVASSGTTTGAMAATSGGATTGAALAVSTGATTAATVATSSGTTTGPAKAAAAAPAPTATPATAASAPATAAPAPAAGAAAKKP
jgi:type IV pilus assembly protein PilN